MYPYSDAYKASTGYQSAGLPGQESAYRNEVPSWSVGAQVPYGAAAQAVADRPDPYGRNTSSIYAQPAAHAAPQPQSTMYTGTATHQYRPAAVPATQSSTHYAPYPTTSDTSRSVVDRSREMPASSPERRYSSKRSDDSLYPRAPKAARVDEEDEYLYSSASRKSREREEDDRYYRKPQYAESRDPPRKRSSSPVLPGLTKEQQQILLKTLDAVKKVPSSKRKEEVDKYDTCVYLGLDDCHPDFQAIHKVRGERDENLMYLRRASDANIEVRGEGTIYAPHKPCHLYIGHSTLKGMQEAEKLALSLIDVVQREYKEWCEKRRVQGVSSRVPQTVSKPRPRSPVSSAYYSSPPKVFDPKPEPSYERSYPTSYPTSYPSSYPPHTSGGDPLGFASHLKKDPQDLDYLSRDQGKDLRVLLEGRKKKKVPTATLR